jgi:germ cell nuclear factor
MEVMERLIYLFRKFHQLKVSNEEYACMKAINFLNQGKAGHMCSPLLYTCRRLGTF